MKTTTQITVTLQNDEQLVFIRENNFTSRDVASTVADAMMIEKLNPKKVEYKCISIEGHPVEDIAKAIRERSKW